MKPAATTVTRTSSPSASSITAPKMILAFRRRVGDQSGCFVDLEQAEIGTALDRQQDALRAVDARFQERARYGHLRGGQATVVAACRAEPYQCRRLLTGPTSRRRSPD